MYDDLILRAEDKKINWYPGHMARARRQLADQLSRVDVVVELCDARIPRASRNPDLGELVKNKKRLLVLNKADQEADPLTEGEAKWLAGDCPVFYIAAKTGQGVRELADWLGRQAVPQGEVLVTSQRQAHLMEQAAEALRAAVDSARAGMTADAFLSDAEQAVQCIGKITGRVASDDIAQAIFSRFCVGK